MIAAPKARPRKTIEDFMSLPEGTRAELIEGELFMCPSPRQPHQWATGNLFARLAEFVHSRKLGKAFSAPFDVHLPTGDIVEPDILYVAKARLEIVQDWVRGSPDLVVEVLSPDGTERDRIVKRNLYARSGIGEYWIVDPEAETIEVFVLRGRTYEPAGYFQKSDTLTSLLLPEFRLALSDVFEDPFEPRPS